MKALVTGGAGFIGSHIVDAYLAAGLDVVVVDDLSTGDRARLAPAARFVELDIRDPGLAAVFERERPDVVNHQAALANVRESLQAPLLYADVNVLGSLNVIFASTGGAIYGEPQSLPVTEDHPRRPLDPYGASKDHVERYLQFYRDNYGLASTILRYANVYGPRQDPRGEAGVVAVFAGQMLRGTTPVIFGSGAQVRDFTYVSDVVQANLLALTCGDNQVLNISSGVGTSISQLYTLLAELTEFQGTPGYGPAVCGAVDKIRLDHTRVRQVLGWVPQVSLAEGLARTIAYMAAHLPGHPTSVSTTHNGKGNGYGTTSGEHQLVAGSRRPGAAGGPCAGRARA
jgi:UDP-glucose 4-epimerase